MEKFFHSFYNFTGITRPTAEELAVYHAEDVLDHQNTLERVLEAEPNAKSKILSFFRVAKSAYHGDERLSRAAGRLYERFEKAFNDFAARNKANLADHIHNFDGVLSIDDYNGKTEVHLYRKSEQGYYQIITVVSSERKSLQITKLIGVSAEKFEQKFAKK